MKLIIVLILIVIPIISTSQDSFSKYSYLIYGKKNENSIRIGTGFFVKFNNSLLLITSRHLIGGYDSYGKREVSFPDTLFIRVPLKITNDFFELPISYKSIRDSINPALNFNISDFIIMKITNHEKFNINSIEKHLPNHDISDSEIDSIFGYGFYGFSSIFSQRDLGKLIPKLYSGFTKGEYGMLIYHEIHNAIDSINYFIYPTIYKDLQGASGSPVFQKLKNGEVVFAGIYTSSSPTDNIYMFVKPKLIIGKIFEFN